MSDFNNWLENRDISEGYLDSSRAFAAAYSLCKQLQTQMSALYPELSTALKQWEMNDAVYKAWNEMHEIQKMAKTIESLLQQVTDQFQGLHDKARSS